MKEATLSKIDLGRAELSFGLSNSPNFLAQRLLADPSIQQMATSVNGAALLRALKATLSRKPRSTATAVRPYAYLVALSLQHDAKRLKEAAKLSARHLQWYDQIASTLLATKASVSVNNLAQAPTTISQSTNTFQRNSSKSIRWSAIR